MEVRVGVIVVLLNSFRRQTKKERKPQVKQKEMKNSLRENSMNNPSERRRARVSKKRRENSNVN